MPPRKASSFRSAPIPLPSTYPGLVDDKGLSEDHWIACKDILEGVYKAKDGSRKISDIFRQLPDKSLYEDYYEAIPEPECLDNIATALSTQTYSTPEAFFKQLHLVFLNAKHYNEDESLIWLDANRLEEQIHQHWTAQAEASVFSHSDPYHASPVNLGKKKRGQSVRPSKSATPLPEPTALPAKVSTPAPRPAEPVVKAVTPLRETRATAPATLPTPIPAPVPTPTLASIPVTVPLPTPAPAPDAMPRTRSPLRQSIALPPSGPPLPTLAETAARQAQSAVDDQVVQALLATLPKWHGPQPVLPGDPAPGGVPGSGWLGEGGPDVGGAAFYPNRIRAVLGAIAGYRDQTGQRLAEVLDLLPAVAEIPYLSYQTPLSFAAIVGIANASRYNTLLAFDMDMSRLFEKGRRWYREGSIEYGKVLVLQRLYNALTAPYPMSLPPNGIPNPSPTLFASLPAGPGNARSLHEATQELKAGAAEDQVGFGVTTFRVSSKDRIFTEEARHKGMAFKCGDYVHLINPDDATRPIIGQIFKTFVPTKGYRTHHATVCWYYRPEQTVHTADRMIFDREVFKTGHFCDHPVEDIIERISVQFYVKYIRGRPRAGEYYPGWPIYMCHSRFNDREHLMVRIKNWNSCIPDELRQTDFMSIVPFQRIIDIPTYSSPFLRGVQGPGFLGQPKSSVGGDEDDDEDDEPKSRRKERPRREINTAISVSAGATAGPGPSSATSQQAMTAVSAPPPFPAPAPTPATVAPSRPIPTFQPIGQSFPNRTIAAVMGGTQALDQVAVKEFLPLDTARMFERDARGQVLWFSGPPLPPGSVKIPEQPAHSLEYLAYLAKRKSESGETHPIKRGRWALPTNEEEVKKETEEGDLLRDAWWAEGCTGEQVTMELKALLDSV